MDERHDWLAPRAIPSTNTRMPSSVPFIFQFPTTNGWRINRSF
jgi:hypothetical protein